MGLYTRTSAMSSDEVALATELAKVKKEKRKCQQQARRAMESRKEKVAEDYRASSTVQAILTINRLKGTIVDAKKSTRDRINSLHREIDELVIAHGFKVKVKSNSEEDKNGFELRFDCLDKRGLELQIDITSLKDAQDRVSNLSSKAIKNLITHLTAPLPSSLSEQDPVATKHKAIDTIVATRSKRLKIDPGYYLQEEKILEERVTLLYAEAERDNKQSVTSQQLLTEAKMELKEHRRTALRLPVPLVPPTTPVDEILPKLEVVPEAHPQIVVKIEEVHPT